MPENPVLMAIREGPNKTVLVHQYQINENMKINYLPLLIGNQPFLFMDLINLIPEGHILPSGSCSCLG
jgi:hypothetical protein